MGVSEFKEEEKVGYTKRSRSKLNPGVGLNTCSLWFAFLSRKGHWEAGNRKEDSTGGGGECHVLSLAERMSGLISCTCNPHLCGKHVIQLS